MHSTLALNILGLIPLTAPLTSCGTEGLDLYRSTPTHTSINSSVQKTTNNTLSPALKCPYYTFTVPLQSPEHTYSPALKLPSCITAQY